MIGKLVMLYKKAELGIINSVSGASKGVPEETEFYDLGHMQTAISKVQQEIKRIDDEISNNLRVGNNSDSDRKYRAELNEERKKQVYRMIFLASNSFKNLGSCEKMADGYSFDFMECVHALERYDEGDIDTAYKLLEKYNSSHGKITDHYLINKVYGLIQMKKRDYGVASVYLSLALQRMPDDVECLKALRECYGMIGDDRKAGVVSEVLSLIE